jgi:hypothetical protein
MPDKTRNTAQPDTKKNYVLFFSAKIIAIYRLTALKSFIF